MLLYSIFWSLVLSWQDWKYQSYPLWFWGIFTLPLLFLGTITPSFWIFLALALLFELFSLGMGVGDFLYLATISLILPVQEILWLIQIACLTGLLGYWLSQKQGQSLAFIPFLSLAFIGILLLKNLLG